MTFLISECKVSVQWRDADKWESAADNKAIGQKQPA